MGRLFACLDISWGWQLRMQWRLPGRSRVRHSCRARACHGSCRLADALLRVSFRDQLMSAPRPATATAAAAAAEPTVHREALARALWT